MALSFWAHVAPDFAEGQDVSAELQLAPVRMVAGVSR